MKLSAYPYLISAAMILAGVTTGCSDDTFDIDTAEQSPYIKFNAAMTSTDHPMSRSGAASNHISGVVRMEVSSSGDSLYLLPKVEDFEPTQEMLSRGTMVTSQGEMYKQFYVSAYTYTDTWDDSHSQQSPNYFNADVTSRQGSLYQLDPVRYWPENGNIRFIAHGPVADKAFTYVPNDETLAGPHVHIKIADKVTDQNDLVVSYSEEIACSGASSPANLNFKHALTGIRFTCDKSIPKGMITNITFKGVKYEGDYHYKLPDGSQSSTSDIALDDNITPLDATDKEFSLDLNYQITGEDGELINDGEDTFMMLPQTLPDDATVEITLAYLDSDGNPTGRTDIISGALSGRQWPAGKIVTYKISTSDQILEVDSPRTFDYLGNVYDSTSGNMLSTNSITVASYAGDKNIDWTVQYMDEGATSWSNKSTWLSVDSSWSWQDTAEQTVPFVATSTYNAVDIDANLKAATSKGSSAVPYNLSSSTGTAGAVESTANCYMVDAPGYYIFPLVYGNAIKNSATNSSAYIASAAGTNSLPNFKNHLNANITAPYIADNSGCVPAKAAIVWQDANNLVQNVQYVASAFGGKGGISFYVSPSTIAQGNAVISISDGSNVLWSWHIWVTTFKGFDSSVDLTNGDGNSFTLMPVNLGWCSNGAKVRYYPKRSCKVRFVPNVGDESLAQEVTFVQESHTSIPFGNNPYYQWGRKDPFVGTNIAWGNKERWDGTGKYYGTGSENNPPRLFSDLVEDTSSDRLTTKECLGMMIENPDKWHNPPAQKGGSSYVSLNETYDNLWGENTLTDTKTVYDPCPVGYQVNYFYTYTGFLDAGYNWTSDQGIEFVKATASDWDTTNLAEFYTDSTKLHSITFPVCGYRDWNDKAEVVDFTVRGFIWMRGLTDNLNAYMFRYAAHQSGVANVAPVTMFYSTDGLPIRPALSK